MAESKDLISSKEMFEPSPEKLGVPKDKARKGINILRSSGGANANN